LIELLCVISIIALLAGLLLPVTGKILERANDTKCVNNLQQIGVAASAAANDNDNMYPIIEIDSNTGLVAGILDPDAKPLDVALKPYGITPEILKCPADLKGPNNYAKQNPHSSYMWSPYSEETNSVVPTITRRRGQTTVPLSRLQLASDWSAVHSGDTLGAGKKIYSVYGDGHVKNH
jgi:type II secretory pathway pseudopilin PulG